MLAATAFVALIAAAPSARAELELTLNFPVAVGGPITAIIDEYAKTYSEQTEGVTILPVYTGSYQDTITRTVTAFKGGNAPDMAVLLAVDTFTLYDEDMIVAISDLAKSDEEKAWLESFYPAFLENGSIDGQLWGVPFQRSTPVSLEQGSLRRRRPSIPRCRPPPGRAGRVRQLTLKDRPATSPSTGCRSPPRLPYWLFQGLTTQNDVILMNRTATR